MARNDVVLLDTVLGEGRGDAPDGLDDDEYFEYFTAEQILKNYDEFLPEDVLAGVVGGGRDGGIDAIYAFEDDRPLEDDSDLKSFRRGGELLLYVVQAKRSQKWQEVVLQRISDTLTDLLDLTRTREELEETELYSDQLLARVEPFRAALKTLAGKRPKIRVVVVYATKADIQAVSAGIQRRADNLKQQVESDLADCAVAIEFLGARQLLDLARREPSQTLELEFHGTPSGDGNSYVALVTLESYFKFITEHGTLRRYIFEGNVRDFQGEVKVNKAIRESLISGDSPQFWWLNNGVTVIGSDVRITGSSFVVDDVQIVNGLQTSTVIYDYFTDQKRKPKRKDRLLLVRLIDTADVGTRDKIIQATNNQTAVPVASLHATDELQRDIEDYFRSHGLFYDRRKNYYRNQGKPADKIVSIPYLAQSIMAIALSEPNQARARPSSLLNNEADYGRVFDRDVPLRTFYWVAKTQKTADAFLRGDASRATSEERLNLRFHLSMMVVARALRHRVHSPSELASLTKRSFSTTAWKRELTALRKALREYQRRNEDVPIDRLAKSRDFLGEVLSREFPEKKRPVVRRRKKRAN